MTSTPNTQAPERVMPCAYTTDRQLNRIHRACPAPKKGPAYTKAEADALTALYLSDADPEQEAEKPTRKKSRPYARKSYVVWKRDEIETLRTMREGGAKFEDIGAKLGRSAEAVKKQHRRLMDHSAPKYMLATDRQKQVSDFLAGKEWVATTAMREALGFKQATASRILVAMVDAGLVERRGGRTKAEWRLTKAAAQ